MYGASATQDTKQNPELVPEDPLKARCGPTPIPSINPVVHYPKRPEHDSQTPSNPLGFRMRTLG
jgi:hypothetical protein